MVICTVKANFSIKMNTNEEMYFYMIIEQLFIMKPNPLMVYKEGYRVSIIPN
jgi:hypothetical protein